MHSRWKKLPVTFHVIKERFSGSFMNLSLLFSFFLTFAHFASTNSATITEGIQNEIAAPSLSTAYTYTLVLNGVSGSNAYCCSGYPCNGVTCSSNLPYADLQYVNVSAGGYYNLGYDITLAQTSNPSNTFYEGSVNIQFNNSSTAGYAPTITNCSGGTCSLGPIDNIITYSYPVHFTPNSPVVLAIQNNSPYYFSFSSSAQDPLSSCCIGNSSSCTNAACSSVVAPGGTQYVNLSSQGFINLEYIPCTENEASCPSCSTTGSFGVTFTTNPTVCSVVNQDNGTATVGSPASDVYGVNFVSTNLPCPLGSSIPTPQVYSSMPYRGVNLAGCDFATFYPPCACNAVYFVNQGASTIRLPVLWEYLQPGLTPSSAPSPIDFTTGDALVYANLVNALTASGLYVIIDMHNYMRYDAAAPGAYITGPDFIIGSGSSTALTVEQYVSAWQSIAEQFVSNPLVMFDLMNEPNDMSTYLIVQNYNAAMAAIRTVETNAGVPPHLIHLEGNSYSCLGTWTTTDPSNGYDVANSVVFVPGSDPSSTIVDPSDNYVIHVHEYFTGDGSPSPTQACGSGTTTTCIPAVDVLTIENFSAFTSYLQTNHLKAFLGELNGAANSNCADCVNNLLSGLETIPYSEGAGYGFVGWTGWAGGSFNTSYILNLTPTYSGSTETQTIQMLEGFIPHMTPL